MIYGRRVHYMVSDDWNDVVVVRIVLSKDDFLGVSAGKKLHFQLEAGMSAEDSSAEKHEVRPSSYAEAVRMGVELDGGLSASQKAEILARGFGN